MIANILILWAGILIGVVIGGFICTALAAGAEADLASERETARRKTVEDLARESQR